jgi:hypothetical protein
MKVCVNVQKQHQAAFMASAGYAAGYALAACQPGAACCAGSSMSLDVRSDVTRCSIDM